MVANVHPFDKLKVRACQAKPTSPLDSVLRVSVLRVLSVQGRASGLVFKKYEECFLRVDPKRHLIVSGRPLVQNYMQHWLESLRTALGHLHSLGFVHNDSTPANIMLDQNDSPVIDFRGLCRVGESLKYTTRTSGWHDEAVAHAVKENDLHALAELKTWLFGSVGNLRFIGIMRAIQTLISQSHYV
ncbi:Uncharacterized protein TCAP_00994 [Tolypocladium capitatum]|uniref:Protein kinase domain-containing protein n=1 Tax=Tolypocladium capitatum TaxID=45235 RepID=A0A2K3QNI0_9HYPO|nr:Uncharacterized protein TCAP_00994 [Tolypocladium capitatum]